MIDAKVQEAHAYCIILSLGLFFRRELHRDTALRLIWVFKNRYPHAIRMVWGDKNRMDSEWDPEDVGESTSFVESVTVYRIYRYMVVNLMVTVMIMVSNG